MTNIDRPATTPVIRPIDSDYFRSDEYQTITVATRSGAQLDFCGIKHSNDPESSVIARVHQELGEFLQRPSDHQKIVMIEGWKPGIDTSPSEDEIVQRTGEAGLANKLASEANVEIMSPEPAADEEFAELSKEFPPQQVLYWLVARQAEQWSREVPLPAWHKRGERKQRRQEVHEKFDNYIGLLESALGHVPSFAEVGTSFEMLGQTHEELFGGNLDWNKIHHFRGHTNPVKQKSVINQIMRRSNEIRDEHIAGQIEQALRDDKDVFAVYGDGHAYTLEPVLKSFSSI